MPSGKPVLIWLYDRVACRATHQFVARQKKTISCKQAFGQQPVGGLKGGPCSPTPRKQI
jgi:hypothetical protein